jgi:pilus assembly protein FimV
MARSPANLVTATLLGLPATGLALGLGDIQLNSALNQPLDARIEILGASPQDLRDLQAAIAGRETFNRYGLEYSNIFGSLRFSVEKDEAGRDVLRVTSPQPVTEPFLTFLIEADWSRGRLLREYTVLLDPPVFMPEQTAPAVVQAPRGAAAQPGPGAGTIERAPEPVASAPAPAEPVPVAPATTSAASAAPVTGEYRVQRGDTLWLIANRTRTDTSTTLNQMMVALYRANPDAFLGNMNLLKEGATLRVPDTTEIAAVSDGDAAAEFARQTSAWRGGAATATAGKTEAQLRLVPPASDTGTQATPAAAAPGTATGTGGDAAQAAALAARVQELERQLAEATRKLELQSSMLARMERELAGGSGEPAGAAPEEGAPAPVAGVDLEPEPVAEAGSGADVIPEPVSDGSEPVDAEAETAAETTPAPAPAPVQPVAAGDDASGGAAGLLGQTWVWIAAGLAFLLAAGGIALRRRKAATPFDEAFGKVEYAAPRVTPKLDPAAAESTEPAPAPAAAAAPEPLPADTGTFEITGTFRPVELDTVVEPSSDELTYPFEDSGSALAIDQADPISEAEFHMAYGLYDQAAELIRKALEREPDRQDLKLKLLEIFFVWGNKDAFRDRARAFQAELQSAGEWDKIVIMGQQLCPGDSLFAGGAGADAGVDLDLASSGERPGLGTPGDTHGALDFDLDDALEAKADLHAAETVPATGEYLEMAAREAEQQEMPVDEELTEVARRLEARMKPRKGDVGVALDLGETIAPEDVKPVHTLTETSAGDSDDDAFGDFFAFTGVAETPEPDPTGTREVVLDFEGDMLPDSTTAEFKIELPEDGGSVDLDLGLTGTSTALPSDALEGDTTRVLTQGGDTTVVSSFGGDTESLLSPGYVDPNARTVQAPMPVGLDFDVHSSGDDTVSTDALDLDVGAGGAAGASDRNSTVRVSVSDLALPEAEDGVLDEVGTKLDLARAYIDMGDPDGARSILEEVIEEGDESQRENAHNLLRSIA